MAEPRMLTPQERMQLFNQNTRQHMISLPSRALPPSSTVEYELPKVRLTSRLLLKVEGTITLGGTGTATPAPLSPARFLRSVRLSINNGFNPFNLSGRGLFLHNMLQNLGHAETVVEQFTIGTARAATNAVSMLFELPLTLNQRDAIGLINTANPQTVVNLVIDTDTAASLYSTAETITASSFTVTPIVESFSIPADPMAIPDLSILKLVHEFSQVIPATGEVTFELQTGLTYRKMIALYEDGTGAGMAEGAVGDLFLILNQADFPYIVRSVVQRDLNALAYSHRLPAGVYVFDFTGGGTPNYGGSRDYIDTERLTEFWLRTNVTATGRLTVVTETLARLA